VRRGRRSPAEYRRFKPKSDKNKSKNSGAQFTCFNSTKVQILTETEASCRAALLQDQEKEKERAQREKEAEEMRRNEEEKREQTSRDERESEREREKLEAHASVLSLLAFLVQKYKY
jgi:hypothetical protein